MKKTVTDPAYSRSPECPFIINEKAMGDLRKKYDKCKDKNTMLPPDAQDGIKKSIAAALKERKRPTPEGKIHPVGPSYTHTLWMPGASPMDGSVGTPPAIRRWD